MEKLQVEMEGYERQLETLQVEMKMIGKQTSLEREQKGSDLVNESGSFLQDERGKHTGLEGRSQAHLAPWCGLSASSSHSPLVR